jgi:glycosyltransferase involved in cell wall biosynthesis
MKLSIIIPAYNEGATLKELVQKVLAVQWPHNIIPEIIIVNDGSKDNTSQIAHELETENQGVIFAYDNEKNSGKSQTVRNGILKSTGILVVIQDADFEYDPNEIKDLINLMMEKELDVVYGNRFGKKNKVIYWQNYIGNLGLSAISNLFTFWRIRTWIPDMEVCYKLIRGDVARDVAANIVSKSNFGIEPEITAKLSRYKLDGRRLKFGVVPISYFPRSIAEGKKMNALKDGFYALKEIVKFNLFG